MYWAIEFLELIKLNAHSFAHLTVVPVHFYDAYFMNGNVDFIDTHTMSENVLHSNRGSIGFRFFYPSVFFWPTTSWRKKIDCEMEINLIHLQSCIIMHAHSTVAQTQYLHTSPSQFAMCSEKWTIIIMLIFLFPFNVCICASLSRAARKLKKRETNHHAINVARVPTAFFVHFFSQIFACQQTNNALFFRAAAASSGDAAGFLLLLSMTSQYVFKRSFPSHTASTLWGSHTQRAS